MKLTARNDQVTIKSQYKPDFASRKYGYWRKSASWEKSKVRALTGIVRVHVQNGEDDFCIQTCTVDSRYLELGYLEVYEVRSVYLNQKYTMIAF